MFQFGQLMMLISSVVVFFVICFAGSHVTMRMYARFRRADDDVRSMWLMLTTLTAVGTIWSLHFLSITLANAGDVPYQSGLHLGLSLLGILAVTTLGFMVAGVRTNKSIRVEIGGAIIGFGVAAIHLNSLIAAGEISYRPMSVAILAASFAIVAALGAFATNRVARPLTRFCSIIGAASFSMAIIFCYVITNASKLYNIPIALQDTSAVMAALTVCAVGFAIMLSGMATLVIDERGHRAVGRKLNDLALSDHVTGQYNRSGFEHEIANRLESREMDTQRFMIIAIDLHEIVSINNAHGHNVGEYVLRTQANRLANLVSDKGAVGRIDGHWLAVMSPNYYSSGAISIVQKSICDVLSQPIEWENESLIATGNLGATEFPTHGDEAATLVMRAEIAAKRSSENESVTLAVYDEAIDERQRSNSALAMDLRHAISRNQLEMYFQPQHSVDTRELVGFEALMRWHHPEQGMVPPFVFIPIAESTGQIIALGDWALLDSCTQAASWVVPAKIAVNVASQQLMAGDFVDKVSNALQQSGLAPQRLEIEITESGLIGDHTRALAAINAVKALGVGIAMDDYGTGYSSLSTLRSFPFDKIKIDREFIKDVEKDTQSQAIVHATIALGQSLEIPVLAEGVESEAHLNFLTDAGCDTVQGYLFGKPMPATSVCALLVPGTTGDVSTLTDDLLNNSGQFEASNKKAQGGSF